jgi:hypothetical protein
LPKPKLAATFKAAEAARRQRVARQEVEKQAVKAAVAKVRQQIMLDTLIVLVGGEEKQLRYCTAGELCELGNTYVGIVEKVMDIGGPDVMVGEVICQRDLEEIGAQSEKGADAGERGAV